MSNFLVIERKQDSKYTLIIDGVAALTGTYGECNDHIEGIAKPGDMITDVHTTGEIVTVSYEQFIELCKRYRKFYGD